MHAADVGAHAPVIQDIDEDGYSVRAHVAIGIDELPPDDSPDGSVDPFASTVADADAARKRSEPE
jgi:hypothetical protein